VLTVLGIFSSIFLWTMTQNSLYNQAVKESRQMDADRLSERVIASDGNYSISGSNVRVKLTLANKGPVSAQVLTFWVLDENNGEYKVTDLRESNYNLNPGDTQRITIEVPILGVESDHTFNSWFVTARGNLIPVEEERFIIVAQLAQGIGSMALDFYTFRYFTYNITYPNSPQLINYPEGNTSFTVPHNTPIAFGVVLTNLDPSRETITFDKYSQLWLYFPITAPGAKDYAWYIVNVNEKDGTIQSSYSEISIDHGDTKLIVFASYKPGSFIPKDDKVSVTNPNVKNTLCAVNLLLHGRLGDGDYGQNIPFVSLYVTTG